MKNNNNRNGSNHNWDRIWKYVEKNEKKWEEHLAKEDKRWADNAKMWWSLLHRMDRGFAKMDERFTKNDEKFAKIEVRLDEQQKDILHILSEFRRHVREH